jgi:hypothetical protein
VLLVSPLPKTSGLKTPLSISFSIELRYKSSGSRAGLFFRDATNLLIFLSFNRRCDATFVDDPIEKGLTG